MTMLLRPPQQAGLDSVLLAIRAGLKSGLVVLPTGVGKTRMALALCAKLDWPTLFLVHRDRLIQQTIGTAAEVWPRATVGVIKGGRDEWQAGLFDGNPRMVVASVQSLHESRLHAMPRDLFGLIVCDEAHHAASPSWSRILEWFHSWFLLGLTATPARLDRQGLSDWFGREPLFSYSIFRAIEEGYLVPVDSRQVRTELDLSALPKRGDFPIDKLAKMVNTPSRNEQVVEAWMKHASDRRTIAFCVDTRHCDSLAQRFANRGAAVGVVHSKTGEDNDGILNAFAAGELQVLVSCEVLTEGFDDPGVACILMCRPTMSRALYIQCVGRGLRLAPGKKDCMVIDFTDNHDRHKLVCSLDLFRPKKKRIADALPPFQQSSDRPMIDVPVLSWHLDQSCPWPSVPNLDNYAPIFPWDNQPASDGQMNFLRSLGVRPVRHLTRGEASYLIDRCKEFESCFPAPATPRQRYTLERAGLWIDGMGKRQASVLIANLKRQKVD